jgi:hypothetical protein
METVPEKISLYLPYWCYSLFWAEHHNTQILNARIFLNSQRLAYEAVLIQPYGDNAKYVMFLRKRRKALTLWRKKIASFSYRSEPIGNCY